MATSKRFDQAIDKLYRAFHADELNPMCCKQCAVGNICDNTDAWRMLTDTHGSTRLNYIGMVNETFGRSINGYLPSELLQIEAVFLKACGYSLPFSHRSKRPLAPTSKETLFDGLSAVVDFLCQLEGIPNVMDCEKLFNFDPTEVPLESTSISKSQSRVKDREQTPPYIVL